MYIYKTLDSKKVQDVKKYANRETRHGWELFQVFASNNRHVSIFRKDVPETTTEEQVDREATEETS